MNDETPTNPNHETALQPVTKAVVTQEHAEPIDVSATTPDEMQCANQALIAWCKRKIDATRAEAADLFIAYGNTIKMKWKSAPLERLHQRAMQRTEFFQKILVALEHGYYIVPNFPVSAFAVRTDRKKPLKLAVVAKDNWHSATHEQLAQSLPAGEGEYKNPFPVVFYYDITSPQQEAEGKTIKEYYAKEWDDLEFPLTMAKPQMIEATTRAMALKVFDDFGILPAQARVDPMIVARIRDPRSTKCDQRFVTFIIGWRLETRFL